LANRRLTEAIAKARRVDPAASRMSVSKLLELYEAQVRALAGVGTAEASNLEGHCIYFETNRITLYRKKTETGYEIPIFPQLRPFLERLKAKGQITTGQKVFLVRDPKKALKSATLRLQLPRFSPRSVRRCFITRCIELGVDFKTIASWQGHKDGAC
jgi:integrase